MTSHRQQEFQQKMARLHAKAQSSGRGGKTSYYEYGQTVEQGPTMSSRIMAFVVAALIVVAVRAIAFRFPEHLDFLAAYGIPRGVVASALLPVLAFLIVPRLLGHTKKGLFLFSLAGFAFMFVAEELILVPQFPEQAAMVYSPEYVTFVANGRGGLVEWLNRGAPGGTDWQGYESFVRATLELKNE
jgi:hypothetical protein